MKGIVDTVLVEPDTDMICEGSDFVITALPHGVSSRTVPLILEKNIKVIDHSGDYRLKNISAYLNAYGIDHSSPEYIEEAVYGLPEIYRDRIAKARLVSNPGCYPTCAILGMAPLLLNKAIKPDGIIINGASGVSGAGRNDKPEYSYCETADSYKPYKPVGHRHTPEIEQEFTALFGTDITLTFTPHLIPIKRGMICTIYADLADSGILPGDIGNIYRDAYGAEYFVRFLGYNSMPQTRAVTGTNNIDISFVMNSRTNKIIIFSALDNLGKGASSQAVQCLNLMAGLEEDTGLHQTALYI